MVHPQERPGTQLDDESGALPSRFTGQVLAGLGDGIGIDRVTYVTRFAPFQMLGKVQDPLTGDSSTDARGHRIRRIRARESEKSAPGRTPTGLSWAHRFWARAGCGARSEDTRFRISGPRAPLGGTPGASAPRNAREPAAPEVPPAHVLKPFSQWMDYWRGLRSALAEPSTLKMPHRPWLTWFSRPPSR